MDPDMAGSASTPGDVSHSPMGRKPRPHSIAGRLPGYATPTFASQARHGRNTDKKFTGNDTTSLL